MTTQSSKFLVPQVPYHDHLDGHTYKAVWTYEQVLLYGAKCYAQGAHDGLAALTERLTGDDK